MKISAVIPAFNSRNYIEQTLVSLVSQTTAIDEIIIVDDGSQDNTINIVEGFASKTSIPFQILKNKANKGVSYSRNRGVEVSKNDYILFLDSDDIILPNFIRVHKQLWGSRSSSWVLSFGSYKQIDQNNKIIETTSTFKQVAVEEMMGYLFVRNYVYLSGTIVRKSAFIEAEGFKEELNYSEDWDLWLRLSRRGGFLYQPKPLLYIRRHESNTSKNLNKMLEGEAKVLSYYDVEEIKAAILKRNISYMENMIDYAAVLFRKNLWDLGVKELFNLEKLEKDWRVYFYISLFYIKKDNYEKAHYYLICAHKITNKIEIINNLGALYYISGDTKKGKVLFLKAVELNPNYQDALYNLQIANANSLETPRFTWRVLREKLLYY